MPARANLSLEVFKRLHQVSLIISSLQAKLRLSRGSNSAERRSYIRIITTTESVSGSVSGSPYVCEAFFRHRQGLDGLRVAALDAEQYEA